MERQSKPPKVDFGEIAKRAIIGGIFTPDEEAIRLNAENPSLPQKFPTSMLEIPYPNGPMVIERFEEDVPVAVMNRFRKNWVAANRLLLPNDQVLGYFHQRFVAQDVFQSASMRHILAEYTAHSRTGGADPTLSFQVEGVDRSSKNRALFTPAEQQAGVELVATHPEVALTILGYQSVVQDYLQQLGTEFQRISLIPDGGVAPQDLANYAKFVEQWDTSNFTMELVPAIALYYTLAKEANPGTPEGQLFNQKLFQDAVDFIVANGAFRNFVPVPADVASDGKARVNHFLCPAVGTIREQLLDGSLLHRIHGITTGQRAAGNQDVVRQAETIQTRAKNSIKAEKQAVIRAEQEAREAASPTISIQTENKTLPEVAGEAIAKVLEKDKPATFSFEGKSYVISDKGLDTKLALEQPQQPGDMVIELGAGEYLYSVLRSAIVQSLLAKRPVYFSFNGIDYRITPDKVEEILSQGIPSQESPQTSLGQPPIPPQA